MGRTAEKVKYIDRESTHVPERDGPWAAWYRARHATAKADAEVRRIDAMIKKAEKKAKAAAGGKPRKPLEGRALEIANDHRDYADRLRRDTQAFLAANPVLPSEAHPILQLWVSKLPKGKRLMVGSDKTYVAPARSKLLGLQAPYVVGSANMRGYIRIDLDESFGTTETSAMPWDSPSPTWKADSQAWGDLRSRIAATGAPLGNIAVGYAYEVNSLERPHIIYLLKDSVFCGPGADLKFRGKIDAIARRLVASMIEIGADPGGLSNSCKSKNPLSPAWIAKVLREEPWTLDELAAALPIPVSQRQLERKHAAWLASRAPKARLAPDHPDPVIASASNQAHRHVCKAAQAVVRQFRKTSTFEAFRAFVLDKALEVCPDPESAVKKADYVAPWTWSKFKGRVPGQRQDPEVVRAARQDAVGRINYLRRKDTMSMVMSAYDALFQELGRKPLVSEVADWAEVGESSVRKYRPDLAYFTARQQKQAVCPQNSVPRQAVAKKDLAILGDGKEMVEATATPVESHPSGQPSIPAPPAPVEMVPSVPVTSKDELAPCAPSSLAPPSSPALALSPAPMVVATDPPANLSMPVPNRLPTPAVLPSSTPSLSVGYWVKLPDTRPPPAVDPPCAPGILSLPAHPAAHQPHHGG